MQTVLLVDDEPTSLKLYERILAGIPGTVPVSYTSSLSALVWCAANDADLVICDYQMPELDGLAFIERFRKLGKSRDIPLIMITSAEERSVRHRALELEADEFLLKPIDHVEFAVRAKNMLRLRLSSRQLADRAASLAQEVRAATADIERCQKETIFRLTRATEYRDTETANHVVRIGHFARVLARALGLPAAEQELLEIAAPMHDVGKVAIPDAILLKPGSLTPSEWEIMKTHAQAGFEILRDSPSVYLAKGAEIALSHHEKFDGTGYPLGLAGAAIPLSGRITAVCDVFDALLSSRPYKKPWPLARAVAEIEAGSGAHFDPAIVDAFVKSLPDLIALRRRFADDAAA